MSDDRKLLTAQAPPKKVTEMTDEELDAFVDKLWEALTQKDATS